MVSSLICIRCFLTLPGLFVFELCVYVFNNKSKFLCNHEYHGVNTRQKDKFHEKPFRLEKTRRCPNYLGVKCFNGLPKTIKDCDNSHSFKKLLKSYLCEKVLYSVGEFVTWQV